jgi:hypothetical protein
MYLVIEFKKKKQLLISAVAGDCVDGRVVRGRLRVHELRLDRDLRARAPQIRIE